MHEPLVQTPAQHSRLVVHDWLSGWQAQVVTPLTTAVCPWQQRLQERIRALPCLLCPRGFLLGHCLPVGMQASVRKRPRRALPLPCDLARDSLPPMASSEAKAACRPARRDAVCPISIVSRSNVVLSVARFKPPTKDATAAQSRRRYRSQQSDS